MLGGAQYYVSLLNNRQTELEHRNVFGKLPLRMVFGILFEEQKQQRQFFPRLHSLDISIFAQDCIISTTSQPACRAQPPWLPWL